jgi:enoyl-CoA hydratase/carnithine racemase
MAVDVCLDGGVAIVILNYPESRNSLSAAVVMDIHRALDQPAVQSARAIVIAGAGPAFCAGANINDLLRSGWMEGRSNESNPVHLFRRIVSHPRPVLAAIEGMALGGGFELVLSCDLAVASANASFALPEAAHGVLPNTGLALLAPMVGRKKALELMLTRRRLSAQEAFNLGLVNVLAPRSGAASAAVALAHDIVAEASPGAIAAIKESLNRHAAIDWNEINDSLTRLPVEEWKEGLSAFIEHRPAQFDHFWDKQ